MRSTQSFAYARVVRQKILDLIAPLSVAQLNQIPEACNNNIAWHLGHLVVSTQLLCYVRTGVQADKEVKYAEMFKNGTRPDGFFDGSLVEDLKKQLIESIDVLEQDYKNGLFGTIQPYSTHTFGLQLLSIEDVLECCALHDTLHYGNIIMMKKSVTAP